MTACQHAALVATGFPVSAIAWPALPRSALGSDTCVAAPKEACLPRPRLKYSSWLHQLQRQSMWGPGMQGQDPTASYIPQTREGHIEHG